MNRTRHIRDHRRPSGRLSRHELLERSDEQLVESVLAGDDAAFEVLFDRHVADSLWYAREVLGSWGEAEEAVRHSFAAAHAYLETRGRGIEFLPWLHTILGNYCLSILQARLPGPAARSEEDATVVDLGEWRLRRKLLGVAFPFAPSGGLRDAVMAACGLGAGAAGAGAPLLGGTLAKIAVVAVLAGGVGVAGNAASDRAASADPGAPAPAVRTLAGAGEPPAIWLRTLRGSAAHGGPSLIGATVREIRRAARVGLPTPGHVPAERAPHVPTTPPDPGVSALPAPAATDHPVSAEAPAPPVESTLRQVADVVEVDVVVIDAVEIEAPAPEPVPPPEPPPPPDLPQIVDDLETPPPTPPVDIEALLSQETNAVLN